MGKIRKYDQVYIDQKEEKENAKSGLRWIFLSSPLKLGFYVWTCVHVCVSSPCLAEGSYLFDILLLPFKLKLIITHQTKLKLVKSY